MLLNNAIKMGTAFALAFSSMTFAHAQAQKVERPPQFVMLAFDGSMNLAFWKESRGFALKMRDAGKPVDWTYFISGVYWLHEKNYALYMPPHIESTFTSDVDKEAEVQRRLQEANNPKIPQSVKNRARGKYSDIGFGNNVPDITERIKQINMAFEEGHEVASHANGHYAAGKTGGSKNWNAKQWASEFKQFIDLIFNAYENNGIPNNSKYASGYAFTPEDVVGFRAPTLSANADMFQTLADFKYKYDTSGANSGAEKATRWPSRNQHGTWVFPLGYIDVAGTAKQTASMDYNFYVMQSHGVDDVANKDKYRDQMYKSYLKYFNDNYYGNRAPIHIGHHFSKWNGGAYWEAMQQFASQVCGMKEVRCVTYTEYVKWLDNQSSAQLKSYSVGSFQKIARPADLKSLEIIGDAKAHLGLKGESFVATAKMDRRSYLLAYKVGLKINNKLYDKNEITLQELRQMPSLGSSPVISAVVLNKAGDEIQSYSLKVDNIGTSAERIGTQAIEEKAGLGDMSEAHEHEHAE